MKINVVSTKLIKPFTPTPQNLKTYHLSFTDESIIIAMNIRILLFYQSQLKLSIAKLEESLSQVLTRFHPLAGRFFITDHLIDCSDQGAEFIEAEALDVESIDLIREMECEQLNHLLSLQNYMKVDEAATSPLLSIQATHFKCGGVAIGVSVSHKIFDGASLGTFITAWSEYCKAADDDGRSTTINISPSFDVPELLPRGNLDNTQLFYASLETKHASICVKRFQFTDEAITRYKLKEDESGVGKMSRVRVVCAVLAKALIGVDRARHGRSRPCLISQAFNMRERIVPPQPKHACGNLAALSITRCLSEAEMENASFGELARVMGEAIEKTTLDCSRILSEGADGLNQIITHPMLNAITKSFSGEANVVWLSDWSKFGFSKTDFGWGKPAWVGIGPVLGENMVILTEAEEKEGGGIDAWVHLSSTHMPIFEKELDCIQ